MLRWFRARRRRRVLGTPATGEWDDVIRRNVGLARGLPESDRRRLTDIARLLTDAIHWEGLDGLVVSDEMRITVAAQAGVLLLGLRGRMGDPVEGGYLFDNVKSVLLSPAARKRPRVERLGDGLWGAAVQGDQWLDGEAGLGAVSLSWREALAGGRREDDGRNLVLHEFAHAFDQSNGVYADGLPPMDGPDGGRWEQLLQEEYEQLCRDLDARRPTLLDPYGATSPVELFAVATEMFFERPRPLMIRRPALYAGLRAVWNQDPAARASAGGLAGNPRPV